MKLGYRIGLFLLLTLIAMVLILLLWKRQGEVVQKPSENKSEMQSIEESLEMDDNESEIGVSQARSFDEVTTCNTICIYENLDKAKNVITIEEGKLPLKYIDVNRDELEALLEEDSKVLTLEEREKGFCSQSLVSFSGEKVKIFRIYDTSEEETGFYLLAVNHYIWVYQKDRSTLYFKTDLRIEELPEEVQKDVIEGKYMESEEAIYGFLESYSS